MPTPKDGESKDSFIKRCMVHPHTAKYPSAQRVAVCSSLYDEHKKKKNEGDAPEQSLRAFINKVNEEPIPDDKPAED